ncbi:MAG: twin-arginine translocation signal domain-containing protein, partial [Pirellula sp.]
MRSTNRRHFLAASATCTATAAMASTGLSGWSLAQDS